ncbi:major Facilitator Superfamily protein [Methyloversatilis sp. RAC08]|uniref:MFS transporter n=1 Tax=Methyloversatilis sp. RAC08 TaxID=1842540 RepID=UPI000856370D|nr:MFS transporter [Methyloversatilis sp. RAC08]AOF83159.1 major Facilitator Superfamily protein [Methyloversatilis sp. RAC08]
MLVHLLPLAALLSGVALLLLGSGLLTTLLAVRGGIEGFGSPFMGLLGSMFFAGFLIGTHVAPRMIRRVGHVRAFAFFTSAVACAVLLHEMLVVPWVWALVRLLTGISMVGLYTIVESWLNSQSAPAQRARVFSVYMGVNLGALALSQQLLHLGPASGHVLFGLAALLVSAAVMPVAATRLNQPLLDHSASVDLKSLYAKAPIALSAAFASGLAMGAFWGLGAVWADGHGIGHQGIAAFMTATILGGALFQWPIGLMSDRMDRGRAIALVSLGATLCAIGLMLAGSRGTLALSLAGFVYGGFAFSLYPMAVARMIDRLQPHEVLSGSSSLLLIHGAGAAAGPLLAGFAMALAGDAALPLWFAATQGALAIAASSLLRRLTPDIAHQTRFQPMVRTASTAFDMVEGAHPDDLPSTRPSTETR